MVRSVKATLGVPPKLERAYRHGMGIGMFRIVACTQTLEFTYTRVLRSCCVYCSRFGHARCPTKKVRKSYVTCCLTLTAPVVHARVHVHAPTPLTRAATKNRGEMSMHPLVDASTCFPTQTLRTHHSPNHVRQSQELFTKTHDAPTARRKRSMHSESLVTSHITTFDEACPT